MRKSNRQIVLRFLYEIIFASLAIIATFIAIEEFRGKYVLLSVSSSLKLDYAIQIIFTFDYFTRLVFAKDRKAFFKENIPDLIAIIPFNSIFRLFRITKLARAFKLARMAKIFKLSRIFAYMFRLIKRSKDFFKTNGLIYVLGFTLFILVASAVAISRFEYLSFRDGLWWSFVTATTVGYGDLSPSSTAGRIIASVLMITGIGTIGMITGTIATFFLNVTESSEPKGELERYIKNSSELTSEQKEDIIDYINYLRTKERK